MLPLRRLVISGGGAHDSGVVFLEDDQLVELARDRNAGVFVYQRSAVDSPAWPSHGGYWEPGAGTRPLAGIQVTSSGPAVRTDLFGLAAVRAEGDEPVLVRLPGLAPIQVGTGRSLERAPGLLGVPPYDPK